MAKLKILGTSSAVPHEDHLNTHFILEGENNTVLIDCIGNQTIRLERAGIVLDDLSDIILTHCHPDHISGVPSLLMSLWLMGRSAALNIYGLHHTLNCVDQMMNSYEWGKWPDFFPVSFNKLPDKEMGLVLENNEFRVFSSPVCHLVPTLGLRIESLQTGKVIAYSCDTEPCAQVERLAKDADILMHEATGESDGHSSAAQAGTIAENAGAKSLYFIHYHPHLYGSQEMIIDARKNFSGEVNFGRDFLEFEL